MEQSPYTPWRFRYAILGIVLCLALIGWGGWVTSIEAGLAVPDWPTSFGSLDPIATGFSDPVNPDSKWWMHTPVLAEHGHRLLGALVGLWSIGMMLWTLVVDRRRTARLLSIGVVALVILQGILGGLRVIWVSLDLAVVHALGAQLFFASIMTLALITSAGWARSQATPAAPDAVRRISALTTGVLFLQVLFGALLRHPGGGVHLGFTLTHIAGSVASLILVLMLFTRLRTLGVLSGWTWSMASAVMLQMMLGVMALLVLLYEESVGMLSVWQVILNSSHLIVGTLLLSITAVITVQLFARPIRNNGTDG